MRFAFIDDHEEDFEVARMCEIFEVSRSGYYTWKNRPMSTRQENQQELTQAMKEIHQETREVYGSPRMHQELLHRGQEVSKNTVAKLMKESAALLCKHCCVQPGENPKEIQKHHGLESLPPCG